MAKKIGFEKVFAAYEGLTNPRFENGLIPRNSISSVESLDDAVTKMKMLRLVYGDQKV